MPWGIGLALREARRRARPESLHFFSTEPLFLIPFGSLPARPGGDVRREEIFFGGTGLSPWPGPRKLGGKARAESLHFFSAEPLFLIRFGLRSAPRKTGGQAARSSRRHFFSTEPLSLIPPDSNQRLPEAKGSGLPESKPAVICSRSPFILFNSPETLGRTRAFSRSAFVSSSLHGDSGIPAGRKTDASVFRLLPPTS